MLRPTKKARTIQQSRHEPRAALKLCPWVAVVLLLVAVFWQADLAATTGLFQSPLPESETVEATAEPTPTVTLELTPTATLEPTPIDTPNPEPAATELAPTATATPEGATEEGETRGRYVEGESELSFRWGMLLDSLALAVSYIWLCCGAVILIGIPVLFIVVWSASRRRGGPSE